MNLFYKRPLCLILCIMLGGFLFFSLADASYKTLIFSLSIGFICLSVVFFLIRKKFLYITVSLALFIGILFSEVYFGKLFFSQSEGLSTVVGTVEETQSYDYSIALTVRAQSVNGEDADFLMRAVIGNDEMETAWVGDTVSFTGKLVRASDSYLLGRGISNEITEISAAERLEKRGSVPLSERLGYMRQTLSLKLINYTNPEAGGLIAALITGERAYLEDGTSLNFRRAGLMHILALSGMHLAIIVLAISKLLYLFKIPYKPRLILSLLFGVAYTVFVGCPITALRALLMLAVVTLLRLLSRSSDPPTSIAIALALIIFATPYAIYDTSLWLSVLATAGVIGAGGFLRSEKRNGESSGILSRLKAALLPTVFALSLISVISIRLFGSFSLASPLATLIVSLPVELLIYLSLIMLSVGNVIPISVIIKPLCSLITYMVGAFSEIEWIYLTTSHPIFTVLSLILFISATLFFVLKIKRKALFLKIHVALFLSFFAVSGIISVAGLNKDTVTVSAYDGRDFILASDDGKSVFFSGSKYSRATGYDAIDFLEEAGKLYVDKYCVGYYSMNLPRELSTALSSIKVGEVLLPTPKNDDERYIANRVKDIIGSYGAVFSYYSENAPVRLNDISLHLLHSREYGTGTALSAFALEYEGKRLLYLSSGALTHDDTKDFIDLMDVSDALILGSSGGTYKDDFLFDKRSFTLSTIVSSSKNLLFSQQCEEYYKNNGCEIISHPYYEEIFD